MHKIIYRNFNRNWINEILSLKKQPAVPLNGQNRSGYDHYLHYPEIFNKDSYFAVTADTTQVGNLLENFQNFSENFQHYLAHYRVIG